MTWETGDPEDLMLQFGCEGGGNLAHKFKDDKAGAIPFYLQEG